MKRFISLLLCLSLLTLPAFAVKGVVGNPDDLPYIETESSPSAWAKTEVEAAIAAGLVPALTDSPKYTDPITREQFAELVVQTVYELSGGEAFDSTKTSMVHFQDYNTEAIQRAASIGVVNGVGDGNFAPKLTTNREQIASMLARAWTYLSDHFTNIKAPGPAQYGLDDFADYLSISDWAVEGMETLVGRGLMKGTGNGTTLDPEDSCTVEQAILLCYRLYITVLPE